MLPLSAELLKHSIQHLRHLLLEGCETVKDRSFRLKTGCVLHPLGHQPRELLQELTGSKFLKRRMSQQASCSRCLCSSVLGCVTCEPNRDDGKRFRRKPPHASFQQKVRNKAVITSGSFSSSSSSGLNASAQTVRRNTGYTDATSSSKTSVLTFSRPQTRFRSL